MVINVDSTTDNIVSFRPIGRALRDRKLNYAEPRPASTCLTKNPFSLESIDALTSAKTPTTKAPIPAPSASPPPKHPKPAPSTAPPKVDSVYPSYIAKMHLHTMPDFRPCNTASPSYTMCAFGPIKLHCIFGCCRFCNPKHITPAANNGNLIDTGEPPTTLSTFTTTPKANEGTSKLPHCHFLDKIHINIIYGNCTSMGGYLYVLLLFNSLTLDRSEERRVLVKQIH